MGADKLYKRSLDSAVSSLLALISREHVHVHNMHVLEMLFGTAIHTANQANGGQLLGAHRHSTCSVIFQQYSELTTEKW